MLSEPVVVEKVVEIDLEVGWLFGRCIPPPAVVAVIPVLVCELVDCRSVVTIDDTVPVDDVAVTASLVGLFVDSVVVIVCTVALVG